MRTLFVAGCLGWSLLVMAPSGSCGLASADKEAGEPCTRSRECDDGLVCESGTCRAERDGGLSDAEAPIDAALDDAAPNDAQDF